MEVTDIETSQVTFEDFKKTNTCGLQTRQSFKRNEPFRKERGINRKSQVWNFRRREGASSVGNVQSIQRRRLQIRVLP